jgi:peptide-methionine (S)-S-oxide reductase
VTALKGENMSTATLANGCFWCTEAIFKRLKGVSRVTPGYTGGKTQHPNYDQVSMGNTGHAEAIQIEFDTSIISYDVLLDVFFTTHDPTTLNAQGNDIGTQYRSAIFFHPGR